MAYGLQVSTSNGILQLDSEENSRYAHIKSSGTATTFTITSGDVAFIKFPTPSSGTARFYYLINTSGNTYAVRDLAVPNTNASVNYVIVGTQASTTLPSNADSYGFQMRNSQGTVSFDSRKFLTNSNFEISQYVNPNAVRGMGATNYNSINSPADARLTTSLTAYVSFNWSHLGATTATYRGIEIANGRVTNGVSYTGLFYKDSKTFDIIGTFYFVNNSEIILGGTFST